MRIVYNLKVALSTNVCMYKESQGMKYVTILQFLPSHWKFFNKKIEQKIKRKVVNGGLIQT